MTIPVPAEGNTTGERFERFVKIIAALRGEGGCPWDREQTHESISRNMLEEAHEAVAAIESGSRDALAEELGDVLLEVVLQAQIGSDGGEFSIDDVIDGITAKMIRRHPHVFGPEVSLAAAGFTPDEIAEIGVAATPDDVNRIWDIVKKREKQVRARAAGTDGVPAGALDDVPASMPALMQAQDISRKAVARGFEWPTREGVWEQFREESGEYEEALAALADGSGTKEQVELEFGDMLFSLVNVARKDGIDAESALRKTCTKFRQRWSIMESYARDEGRPIDSYGLDGLEELWARAKAQVRAGGCERS